MENNQNSLILKKHLSTSSSPSNVANKFNMIMSASKLRNSSISNNSSNNDNYYDEDSKSTNSFNPIEKSKRIMQTNNIGERIKKTMQKNRENENIDFNNIILEESTTSKITEIKYPNIKPKNFIPVLLLEKLNSNINKNKKKTRQFKNELRDVCDLYKKQKNRLEDLKKEINELNENLKNAKNARQSIINEVYDIKKKIDEINSEKNTEENSQRLVTDTNESVANEFVNRPVLTEANNQSLNKSINPYVLKDSNKSEDNIKTKEELDNEIINIEEQISNLKYNNRDFIEKNDVLLNDYKINKEKNNNLKETLKDIEFQINDLLNQKNII